MAALLGDEVDAFLSALTTPVPGLRVNTLRISPASFAAIAPFPLGPLPFPPEGFLLPVDSRAGAHPYHAAGLCYLQDPGAMVVGAVPELPAAPRVLDLAAAPGGKATHLAARMAGRGVLVANDVHGGRALELAGNLERCGVRNALVTSEAPARLAEQWPGWFDLVLVDAPCSGESMFHKSEAARREWSPAAVAGCAHRQEELLNDAVRLVRPGGMLLYSTCTFAPEEDEGVLAAILHEHPELEVTPLPAIPGAEPGRPDWAGAAADPAVGGALRLWPHHFPGAGHFVAALRRRGDASSSPAAAPAAEARSGSEGWSSPAADALRLAREQLEKVAPGVAIDVERLVSRGDEIYQLPSDAPAAGELRILRPGWWLGTMRKGWFEPAHALAMAMPPTEAATVLDLPASSAEVEAYLRGEVLRQSGPEGWVLICVDGFPLGWGKRTAGAVKNHYPRGLRRR